MTNARPAPQFPVHLDNLCSIAWCTGDGAGSFKENNMDTWILAVVLERSAGPKIHSAHATEQACVATGERWAREAEALRKRMKLPRPTGWVCTPVDEQPS